MTEFNLLHRSYPGKKNSIKREILKHAVMCFKEIGVSNTTMNHIQSRTNFSLRTIYNHCKAKDEIIVQLVIAAIIDLYKYRQKYLLDAYSFEECIYALVISYLDWIEEHPHFSQIILSETFDLHAGEFSNKIKKIRSEYRKKIYSWLLLPENSIGFNNKIPQDLYPSLVNGIPEHYGRYWLLNEVEKSPKKYKKQIALIVWNIISNYCVNLNSPEPYNFGHEFRVKSE